MGQHGKLGPRVSDLGVGNSVPRSHTNFPKVRSWAWRLQIIQSKFWVLANTIFLNPVRLQVQNLSIYTWVDSVMEGID